MAWIIYTNWISLGYAVTRTDCVYRAPLTRTSLQAKFYYHLWRTLYSEAPQGKRVRQMSIINLFCSIKLKWAERERNTRQSNRFVLLLYTSIIIFHWLYRQFLMNPTIFNEMFLFVLLLFSPMVFCLIRNDQQAVYISLSWY